MDDMTRRHAQRLVADNPPRKDVMVDLETYGNTPGSQILSIGAVAFGKQGVASGGFYVVVYRGGTEYGLHADAGTKAWWKDQSAEARKVIDECRDPTYANTLPVALDQLDAFVLRSAGPEARVWGCGADFDNALLRAAYRAVDVNREPAWKFWNNRCYRTLKSLFPMTSAHREGLVHHNAVDDARAQAAHAVLLLQRLEFW